MSFTTYTIHLKVHKTLHLKIGSLGEQIIPSGTYAYTGSAKKNIEARVERHRRKNKNIHWHIDYLTTHPDVEFLSVIYSNQKECDLNKSIKGEHIIKGFGSSDCKKCVSHFQKLHSKV